MKEFDETDVGMTMYLGSHSGFFGILKLRHQDFLVNEVDNCGTHLHITTLDVKESVIDELPQKQPEEKTENYSSVLSEKEHLQLNQLQQNEATDNDVVIIEGGKDKSKRRDIHNAIRQMYKQLESETFCDPANNETRIKVKKIPHGTAGERRRSRVKKEKKWNWFLLYKENIATMDAINLITKKIHLKSPRVIQFAGTKDKRGITVQGMTTTLPVQRLLPINKIFNNISVGNFKPCTSPLRLGDLMGNHFSIVLRHLKGSSEENINAAISSLSDNGFINYFGMQRFGCRDILTYHIGKAILANDWSKAVDAILATGSGVESPEFQKYIRNWKEKESVVKALESMRRKASPEGYLLQGIIKYGPKQLVQALGRIPRNTRLLYLHSYQSFIWNRIVSKRLQVFGKKPIIGDLVLLCPEIVLGSTEQVCHVEPQNKKIRLDDDAMEMEKTKNPNCDKAQSIPIVKSLTKDELDSYNISDVVLPLPGHSITYPNNIVFSWYEEMFAEDGLELNMVFNHGIKDYRLPGAYRKMIVQPTEVEWDLVRYSDYKEPLLLSDRDSLQGKTEVSLVPDGHFQALRIHFVLPSSSYATVAIRELLKSDMSVKHQSSKGEAHKRCAEKHVNLE